MVEERFQKALQAITSLGDPVRRRLYEAVASAEGPVSRNEVAKSAGVARPLVAYHLDRLAAEGLLDVRFERQSGRVGPGAGRPAKLYFRPKAPVRVTIPARDVEFAAELLLEALARSEDQSGRTLLHDLAREAGSSLAREEERAESETASHMLGRLLSERGYEPKSDANGTTWLRNCVFDELASRQRDLVCGMNLSLVQGMLDALPGAGLTARLEPGEGRCCVVIESTKPESKESGAEDVRDPRLPTR